MSKGRSIIKLTSIFAILAVAVVSVLGLTNIANAVATSMDVSLYTDTSYSGGNYIDNSDGTITMAMNSDAESFGVLKTGTPYVAGRYWVNNPGELADMNYAMIRTTDTGDSGWPVAAGSDYKMYTQVKVSDTGDATNAYLLAADAFNTYDMISNGYIGDGSLFGGNTGRAFDNTLTFFATTPGIYALTFNVVQADSASDLDSGTILSTGSITINVTANISFDTNGGTGTMDTIKSDSTTPTLPASTVIAPEGMVFAG